MWHAIGRAFKYWTGGDEYTESTATRFWLSQSYQGSFYQLLSSGWGGLKVMLPP